ncbi:MAG: rod-binding protein [Defluviitaleaceae bacterium]|nr:rod-binding protein [Defluviitaleaceae bacterium]
MQIPSSSDLMMQNAIFQTQTRSPIDNLSAARLSGDDAALLAAAQEFETHFIQQLFRAMRATVNTDNGILPRGQTEEIFQDMIDEITARNAVIGGGGIGLAQQIFAQMTAQQTPLQTALVGEYGAPVDEQ